MIPYVRKSFYKHFCDGLKYVEGIEVEKDYWKELDKENKPIESDKFKKYSGAYRYAYDMTQKECKQATEGMLHNLNSLQSRSGCQLPFSSVNLGLSTEPEGRMVTKCFLEALIKGTGKLHKTSIFPCTIYQMKTGINRKPCDPNYDLFQLALKSTAKRLYPNYCNCDWTNQKNAVLDDRNMKEEVLKSLSKEDYNKLFKNLKENKELADMLDIIVNGDKMFINYGSERPTEINSTMGCRTWNGSDINYREVYLRNIDSVIETGRLFDDKFLSAAQKDGRGNIAPVTIILPTIAMEAKEEAEKNGSDIVEAFMSLLDVKIHEAKDQLIERFDWIANQKPESARFMYENDTMLGYIPEEGIRSALKHDTLAVGLIGCAETLQILIGCDQTTPKGLKLIKRILQLYKDRCAEFKHEYNLNFGVYYTPAENLCYTSMKKFQTKYGKISNISENEFFTNSVHCPVWQPLTPFEKIDIESQLAGYSSAGNIMYTEFDASVNNNIEALEKVVNYAMDKDLPYFAINVPSDTCLDCGYISQIDDNCPVCGSNKIQRLRRVTGYITQDYTTAFNKGKQDEVHKRIKHNQIWG